MHAETKYNAFAFVQQGIAPKRKNLLLVFWDWLWNAPLNSGYMRGN
jgi:hypothetical protein